MFPINAHLDVCGPPGCVWVCHVTGLITCFSFSERSFLDEMSTFVQSAFGGKDGHFLGRNEVSGTRFHGYYY